MPLTPEQYADTKVWFDGHRKGKGCPECGANGDVFEFSGPVAVPGVDPAGGMTAGRDFAISVHCKKCGHIRLFLAVVIGLKLSGLLPP